MSVLNKFKQIAVGDIGGRWRCGRIQPFASDRKLPAYQPPPGKLPPDRAVRVDHVAICHDDAIHVKHHCLQALGGP